jgi:hypothetical protein
MDAERSDRNRNTKMGKEDDLTKTHNNDGFVKSPPASGGTKRANTEERGPSGAATTKLKRNAADELFAKPSRKEKNGRDPNQFEPK